MLAHSKHTIIGFITIALSMIFVAQAWAQPIHLNLTSKTAQVTKPISKTLTIPRYFNATCPDYRGTWQGFFSDPEDLFGNGGPWPVNISLYNHNHIVIGRANAQNAPDYVANSMTGKIWAQCQNGILKNIFLGKKGQCGELSQQGMLISKNVLVMKIHYQNPMIDTHFWLMLKRVNHHYPYPIPTDSNELDLGTVSSCHGPLKKNSQRAESDPTKKSSPNDSHISDPSK